MSVYESFVSFLAKATQNQIVTEQVRDQSYITINCPTLEDAQNLGDFLETLEEKITQQTSVALQKQIALITHHPEAEPYFELNETGHLTFGVKIKYENLAFVPPEFCTISLKRSGLRIENTGNVIAVGSMNMGAIDEILTTLKKPVRRDSEKTGAVQSAEASNPYDKLFIEAAHEFPHRGRKAHKDREVVAAR